jgi:hypothetical protein
MKRCSNPAGYSVSVRPRSERLHPIPRKHPHTPLIQSLAYMYVETMQKETASASYACADFHNLA